MIGIFDSGVGGLSIYRKIKEILPTKKVVYLADKKNFPYGEKSEDELLGICQTNIDLLVNNGAKIIVIACNSATVSVINKLREKNDLPIIGVEPAIKQASKVTKNNVIGLIATKATINNHAGEKYLSRNQKLIKFPSNGLVQKIENKFDEIDEEYLKKTFSPLITAGVDTLALGCTHYYFLKDQLEKIFPEVSFIAPDEAVAMRTKEVINKEKIELEEGDDLIILTGETGEFERIYKVIFGKEADNVRGV